ncbi:unnamed protein product [Macrosiphum euphorbiae]|uniref:Uncharacterized protein n=1 Tax=Macrosiphum euphorbiae TaxID=13131 RepID=A0AAV0XVC5_9HEMI|nr:unnamed protein product [Macrosiphum euphorbiae]
MCSKIRFNVFLLGNECSQITGGKLPSIKQVLLVFSYNLQVVKINIRESPRLAVREIVIFWEKARIPVQEIQHCIYKLEKLYYEWRTVQKNSTKRTECQIKKEVVFTSKLDDLFDIAHANALNMLGVQEDRDFLLLQREKRRKGYMMGVDTKLFQAEK